MNNYLDIETISGTDAAIERELELVKPASNIKDPGKKTKNVEEKRAALRKKAALLDSAEIGCVGVLVDDIVYSFVKFKINEDQKSVLDESGITVFCLETEIELLEAVKVFFKETFKTGDRIVTFNGCGFDMPKLRHRYAYNGLELIDPFMGFYEHVDLMLRYTKYFTGTRAPYISMDEVLVRLGICEGKPMHGDYFEVLIEKKQYITAILYNALDLFLTRAISEKIYHEEY